MKKEDWAVQTEEQREKIRKNKRAWYKSNRLSLTEDELEIERAAAVIRTQKYRDNLSPEKQQEMNDKSNDWKKKNPERAKALCRSSKLKNDYGMTLEDYESLVESQNGCCAICHTETIKLVVDHCHKTKVVRGLLCSPCNTGIGHLKDDVARLQSAIDYLNNSRNPTTPEVSDGT